MGLTVEQQRALALARARSRVRQPQAAEQPTGPVGRSEYGGASNSAMDMLTFGLQSKINAAGGGLIDATVGAIKGEGFNYSDAYNKQLAQQRADQAAYTTKHPVRSGIGTTAGLATGIATLPALAPFKGAGVLPKIGNVASTGTTYGGGAGAVQDADSVGERWQNVGKGATTGALLGTAAYPIVRGGAKLLQKAMSPKAAPLPTTKNFKQASQAAFKEAESYGVTVEPQSYSKLVDDITGDVMKPGRISERLSEVTDSLYPHSKKLITGLQKTKGMDLSLDELDQVRRVADKIAQQTAEGRPTPDAAMAMKMLDKIDNYVDDFPNTPINVASGDAGAAVAARAKAKALWRQMIQSSTIDRALRKAEIASDVNFTQAGHAQAVKREFANLAKSPRFEKQFTPEQQAAIMEVVKGGPVQNFFRRIGMAAPQGGLSQMLHIGSAVQSGGMTVPLSMATSAAQIGASKSGLNKAARADALVKGGPQMQIPKLPKSIEDLLLRLAGQGGGRLADPVLRSMSAK